MKILTLREALTALGNRERVTSDEMMESDSYLSIPCDEIVWNDGTPYRGEIMETLKQTCVRIYKEKKMIKVAKYSYFSAGAWTESRFFYKEEDAVAGMGTCSISRLDYTEIEVEGY